MDAKEENENGALTRKLAMQTKLYLPSAFDGGCCANPYYGGEYNPTISEAKWTGRPDYGGLLRGIKARSAKVHLEEGHALEPSTSPHYRDHMPMSIQSMIPVPRFQETPQTPRYNYYELIRSKQRASGRENHGWLPRPKYQCGPRTKVNLAMA